MSQHIESLVSTAFNEREIKCKVQELICDEVIFNRDQRFDTMLNRKRYFKWQRMTEVSTLNTEIDCWCGKICVKHLKVKYVTLISHILTKYYHQFFHRFTIFSLFWWRKKILSYPCFISMFKTQTKRIPFIFKWILFATICFSLKFPYRFNFVPRRYHQGSCLLFAHLSSTYHEEKQYFSSFELRRLFKNCYVYDSQKNMRKILLEPGWNNNKNHNGSNGRENCGIKETCILRKRKNQQKPNKRCNSFQKFSENFNSCNCLFLVFSLTRVDFHCSSPTICVYWNCLYFCTIYWSLRCLLLMLSSTVVRYFSETARLEHKCHYSNQWIVEIFVDHNCGGDGGADTAGNHGHSQT